MVDALADRAQRNVDDVCRGANQCGPRIFASDHVILMHCPVMIKDLHIQVNLDALPWAFTQDGLDESWLPLLDALVSEGNIPSSDLHYVWLEYGDWLVAACGSNIKVRRKAAQISDSLSSQQQSSLPAICSQYQLSNFQEGGGGKAAMTANKVDYFESEKPAQLRLQHVCVRLPIGLLDSLKASFCRSLDWARSLLTAS